MVVSCKYDLVGVYLCGSGKVISDLDLDVWILKSYLVAFMSRTSASPGIESNRKENVRTEEAFIANQSPTPTF